MQRETMWGRLASESFDLVIIGGGINGAGIARDAARRGLRVAVLEMRDLAYGTSSRSSKLVHGGLRYLEQFAFHLVFESVSERRLLLDLAPHLVNPLGFLFPVYKGARNGFLKINAGMWLYDGLSLFRSPRKRRTLRTADLRVEEPALNVESLTAAPLYYDCSTDDARLTLESALDAATHGAVIASYARVSQFLHDAAGRLVGVKVHDELTDRTVEVRANAFINATGPWSDALLRLREPDHRAMLRPTKGVHIVVRRDILPVHNAVVMLHPTDGRVLFAIPWGDATYVGTTDTDYDGDPADVRADAADIDYLVDVCRHYFPAHPLTPQDIHCTWAGLRPLVAPAASDGAVSESSVSREHVVQTGADGLVTVAGGKLTTYRRMSAEVVDAAVAVLRKRDALPAALKDAHTERAPLPGAVGWPADDDHDAVAQQVVAASAQHIAPDSARLLADTYGMTALAIAARVAADPSLGARLLPHRPELLAQVDHAVEAELACTITDLLKQRTQIFYRERNQGLDAIPVVAARMATLLGWDDATTARMVADYQHEVALSRAWRSEWEATHGAGSAGDTSVVGQRMEQARV